MIAEDRMLDKQTVALFLLFTKLFWEASCLVYRAHGRDDKANICLDGTFASVIVVAAQISCSVAPRICKSNRKLIFQDK